MVRYYDQGVGRFTQMDTWQGNNQDPITLHKYLYAGNDPVLMVDPSGNNFTIGGLSTSFNMMATLAVGSYASYQVGQSLVGSDTAEKYLLSGHCGSIVLEAVGFFWNCIGKRRLSNSRNPLV